MNQTMQDSFNLINSLNLSVFEFFNQTFGKPELNEIMLIADLIANPNFIIYQFIAICLIGFILLFRKRNSKEELKELTIQGFACVTTFLASGLSLAIALILKHYTSVLRPFCDSHNIYTLTKITSTVTCNHSFPSGHTILSIILVGSLWPICNRLFKTLGLLFVIIVAISRMSSGAHYPIDILGAFAIALPLNLYLSHRIHPLIKNYEQRWNIFNKLNRYIYDRIKK